MTKKKNGDKSDSLAASIKWAAANSYDNAGRSAGGRTNATCAGVTIANPATARFASATRAAREFTKLLVTALPKIVPTSKPY